MDRLDSIKSNHKVKLSMNDIKRIKSFVSRPSKLKSSGFGIKASKKLLKELKMLSKKLKGHKKVHKRSKRSTRKR
jgi:hypothetical protein